MKDSVFENVIKFCEKKNLFAEDAHLQNIDMQREIREQENKNQELIDIINTLQNENGQHKNDYRHLQYKMTSTINEHKDEISSWKADYIRLEDSNHLISDKLKLSEESINLLKKSMCGRSDETESRLN